MSDANEEVLAMLRQISAAMKQLVVNQEKITLELNKQGRALGEAGILLTQQGGGSFMPANYGERRNASELDDIASHIIRSASITTPTNNQDGEPTE